MARQRSPIRRFYRTLRTQSLNQELLKERNPELYENLFERYHCIDTKKWMRQEPIYYKEIRLTYYTPSITRKFKILGM